MNLIRLCITRPVGVSVGVALMVLFGLLALLAIPVQLTPNVDTPIVTITTNWRGANPQEVEREIVDRQEEQLRSVKGLRKMTSTSSDNTATVVLEFYPDIEKNEALRDVVDKLNRVSGYPLDMDEPSVAAADTARDSEIAWLILYTEKGKDRDVATLRDFAWDEIKPYLDRVYGIGSTDIYGGREREVQVRVDAGRLAARGLTFRQLEDALRGQNANISAGTRVQGKRDVAIRTVGQYTSAEEILDTVVSDTAAGPTYVRDVADVERTHQRPRSFVRSMGQYVLAFPVRRETGTNVMQVMEGLRAAIRQINEEVLQGRGLKLELKQVYDETIYITQAIDMVQNNIMYGGALAIVVLLLFLRNIRATLIVAASIPISVIGTFLVVTLLGRTINVISLAGMAFAVGMVVDNAVVVLENIFRHKQLGKSSDRAALDGTNEVWSAVLASTLTTVAVFVPVIFVREEAGQLFRDISVATVAAVALSLIVSITVIPTVAARILGTRVPSVSESASGGGQRRGIVATLVGVVVRSRVASLVVVVGMVAAVVVLTPWLVPPKSYLPAGNRNLIFGGLATPPGYSIPEYQRMGAIVEQVVAPYWEVDEGSPGKRPLDQHWIETVKELESQGRIPELAVSEESPGGFWAALERDRLRREWYTPPPAIANFFYVAFGNTCFMGATSQDDAKVAPLTRLLTSSVMQLPGVFGGFEQSSLFRFGGGNNIEVQVRGDDLEAVTQAAAALQGECMRRFTQYPQASPTNFAMGRPELQIRPNRERAADVGMSVRDVGFIVEACGDGAYVGDYRETDGDIVDLVLLVAGQRDRPTRAIGQVPIFTPSGQIAPLSAAVDLLDTTSLEQINHIERQRAVTLSVQPAETMALETLMNLLEDEIVPQLRDAGAIRPGVLISFTGNADKLVEARNTMVGEWVGWNFDSVVNIVSSRFFLSILIVYLLMAALFESWLYPFVIMFSVPMAILGGFLGLTLARIGTLLTNTQPVQQLDVLTFLGFVILIGIVVNNAILLVHQSLTHMRSHGMAPIDAIREAVRVRARPVLMTSLTTFVGQLPLAVIPGAGSELYRGLAAVMLGGMLVSTIGTLVVVPAAMSLVSAAREFFVGDAAAAATQPVVARDA